MKIKGVMCEGDYIFTHKVYDYAKIDYTNQVYIYEERKKTFNTVSLDVKSARQLIKELQKNIKK